MPLIKGKSKKAFSHNVGVEMDAGKPRDQALAIAYSMKRKAKGGMINADHKDMVKKIVQKLCSGGMAHYAKGGPVDHDEMDSMDPLWNDQDFLSDEEQDMSLDQHYPDPDHVEDTEGTVSKKSILDKIMRKHRGL